MSLDVQDVDAYSPPVPSGEGMSRGQRVRLILVLGSFIAIGPLTIDMYLPALPAIGADLLATSAAVQLTLTGTLVGMAVGQLFIGPLSDAFGRRAPLLAGLTLHVVASLLCVVAPTITVLGGLRVLQGFGVAAATVVALAVVRDLFSGAAFARLLSRLLLVMGTAPILAPMLGSALLRWSQWRGVFVALAGFGVLLALVAAFALVETLPEQHRRPPRLGATMRYYARLLRDRTFVGLVLVTGLAMGALFAYVAGSPFVMQEQYGLSEQQFGIVFGAGAAGLIAATQLNARLLRTYPPQRILGTALAAGSVAGVVLIAVAASGAGGLAGLLVPLWLVLAAAGLILPNAPALAMSRHGEAAGTAAALVGAGQFGLGALATPAVGLLGDDGPAMAAVIAGAMIASAGRAARRRPVGSAGRAGADSRRSRRTLACGISREDVGGDMPVRDALDEHRPTSGCGQVGHRVSARWRAGSGRAAHANSSVLVATGAATHDGACRDPAALVVPLRIRTPRGELSLLSTTTVFGTPHDVTVAELAIESFYPVDRHSADLLGAVRM